MSFIRRLCQPVCRNLHWKLSASSQLQIHSRFHNNVTPFCSILLSGNQCVGFPSTSSVFSSEASRRLIHQRGGRKGGPRDTMSKILLQAQSPDEIFRLVTQNPSKIYPNHLSIAIRYSAELCQKYEVTPDFLNSQSFQTICDNLALHCSTLHNRSLIRTVQSMMILRVPRDHVLLIALLNECGARMASLDLIDQSRLLEYMNIMQLKGNKVRDLCVRHVSSQLNEVRNHRAIVPLLDYYNSEYAFEEENTSHENITSEEEKSQDANYSTISQHIINIIHKFLQLNNAPMKHDLLKIGNLLAFTFKWHSFNQELIDILLCNRTFFFFRHNKLIESLGNEIPKYLNNVHPSTMILVAKYISHHAVRNTALLDVLSEYIILRGHYVGLEDVQKIILPIGKLNYIPETHEGLLNKMEDVILQQYKDSPVSVINVVMSLVQMQCFPESVLKIMFLPEFIQSVFDRHVQYDDIEVKLALIDQAVGLDCPNYDGPRLHEEIKMSAFSKTDQLSQQKSNPYLTHALRAMDEITGGDLYYRYQSVLAAGYSIDFELYVDRNGQLLQVDDYSTTMSTSLVVPQQNVSLPAESDSDTNRVTPSIFLVDENEEKLTNQTLSESVMSSDTSTNQMVDSVMPSGEITNQDEESSQELHKNECESQERKLASDSESHDNSHSDSALMKGNEAFYKPYIDTEESESTANTEHDSFYSSYGKSSVNIKHPALQTLGQTNPGQSLPYQTEVDSNEKPHEDDNSYNVENAKSTADNHLELEFSTKPTSEEQREEQIEKMKDKPGVELQHCQSDFKKVAVIIQDKMHFCNRSDILLSRQAMQIRHLEKIGYEVIQIPFFDLDKLDDMEELKAYLKEKIFSSIRSS